MTNIVTINNITLVGTAHVSKESVKEVQATIDAIQPKYIGIELDKGRFETMQNNNKWENTDIVKVIKEKKVAPLLMQIILAAFQKRFAANTESAPGAEFKMAIEKAHEYKAELRLLDRNINITLTRIWRSLTFWQKAKLIVAFLFGNGEQENLDENKLQEIMNEDIIETTFSSLREELPVIHDTLILERNEYMVNNIFDIHTDEKIVVVIGKGHLNGMADLIKQKKNSHRNKELDTIPKKSIGSKVLEYLFPAVIIGLILASFFFGNYTIGMEQLKTWLLWNSSLAALFTLLGRGSLLSVITAFVTAPIGTIHPILNVGMFVALVEAWRKKPTVKDMSDIFNDISHIKTIFKNRFLHIIALFFLSSMGGAIGNIIGGSQLIKNFFF